METLASVVDHYKIDRTGNQEFDSVMDKYTTNLVEIEASWVLIPRAVIEHELQVFIFFRNSKDQRVFFELSKACIGGPFISVPPLRACLPNDLNALVQAMYARGFIQYLEVSIPEIEERGLERLKRMAQFKGNSNGPASPYGSLGNTDLGRFRIAVIQENFSEANEILHRIIRTGRLSSINANFLTLQLLCAQKRFSEVWSEPGIDDVLTSTRPRVVSEFLLVSIWNAMRVELLGNDLRLIPEIWIARIRKLLRTIELPQSIEGRLCLAIVLAIDDSEDERLFSMNGLDPDEIKTLNFIVNSKRLPSDLVGAEVVVTGAFENYENLSVDEVKGKALDLIDEVDARGLVAVLQRAKVLNVEVETVLKALVRLVNTETLVEFSGRTIEELKLAGVDTNGWSKGLRTAVSDITQMDKIFRGGFAEMTKLTAIELERLQRIYVECISCWPLLEFETAKFDATFKEFVETFGVLSAGGMIFSDLLLRLNSASIAPETVSVLSK